MQILNSLYPYPVLAEDSEDYQPGMSFSVDYQMIAATPFQSAKITATFQLNNPELAELITKGLAGMYLHVESQRAAYRKMYLVEHNTIEIEIDPDKMRTDVEITGLILAQETLTGLSLVSINSAIYGDNYTFPDLEVGDPLAVALTVHAKMNEFDNLQNASSVIKVASTESHMMKVDYDQDDILVYLPKQQYAYYVQAHGSFDEVMLMSVIYPALVYVLSAITLNQADDMKDRRWYQVIDQVTRGFAGSTLDDLIEERVDSITLAQKILGDPLPRLVDELQKVEGQDA